MTRQATTRLLGAGLRHRHLIEDGLIERDTVITAALKYMSEADVDDMCQHNGFFEDEDEDTDEDEDEDDEDEERGSRD
jgi:hypothetical protein